LKEEYESRNASKEPEGENLLFVLESNMRVNFGDKSTNPHPLIRPVLMSNDPVLDNFDTEEV
jgi:hypothetical protein